MITQANKVPFHFVGNFDAATAGPGFATPTVIGHKLGVLQAIKHKTATFKAHNFSDAAVTVTLKEGVSAVSTLNLAANAGASVEVDVYGISGAAALVIEVEVTAIGTGTGKVQAVLDVEQPIVVSSC